MQHWWKNLAGVKSHIMIYKRWHNEQIGKENQVFLSQPNSLPNSQLNLAALLLCYKTNNCLWVHSRAHYCFYITSKNLRQVKDIAILISGTQLLSLPLGLRDWGSFWGRGLFPHRNQQVYLCIPAGQLRLLKSQTSQISLLSQESFEFQPTISYWTLEVIKCHSVAMVLAPGTLCVPGKLRWYRKNHGSVSLSGNQAGVNEVWQNLDAIWNR